MPGPYKAFFERRRRRKPYNLALTAVARSLTVLVWLMLSECEEYRYAPPVRTREKLARARSLATASLGSLNPSNCLDRSVSNSDSPAPGTIMKEPGGSA